LVGVVGHDLDHATQWGRRLAIGAMAVIGLLVAAAGVAVTQDACGIGCESKPFRDAVGYGALFLGGIASALALWGRPGVAILPAAVGALAIVAAFFEAMSHLR
jgi:hypothetical protein